MEVFRTAKVFLQNRFTGFLVRARIEAVGEKVNTDNLRIVPALQELRSFYGYEE